MVLIWRGIGIIVPIVFFLFAWILSYWFEDTHFGNKAYLGWISFYTAILSLIAGLPAFAADENNPNAGLGFRLWRHHFFYLPIIFWAGIFGFVSGYCLLTEGKELPGSAYAQEGYDESDTIAKIHFYNPTSDSLYYVISDVHGLFEKEILDPFSNIEKDAPSESYMLAGINLNGESTHSFPPAKKYDETKYVKIIEGEDTILQRKMPKKTKMLGDYEDCWALLSSSYDLLVLDVTDLGDDQYGNGFLVKEKVKEIDWMKKIKSKHFGDELIELNIKPAFKGQKVTVSKPNTLLPISRNKTEALYALIVYPYDQEINQEFLVQQVERLFRD